MTSHACISSFRVDANQACFALATFAIAGRKEGGRRVNAGKKKPPFALREPAVIGALQPLRCRSTSAPDGRHHTACGTGVQLGKEMGSDTLCPKIVACKGKSVLTP